jgi:hypothetical protein
MKSFKNEIGNQVLILDGAMVKLEQFIIHRRKFVLEPYRRKGRKDPTFFYRGMIDIKLEQIPSKFS